VINSSQKSLNKIDNWLNALIYEEGGKMNAGSLRTIELIRKEAGNILRHESLSKVQVDYYEDKIEMLQRLIAERDKTIAFFNEPIDDEELFERLRNVTDKQTDVSLSDLGEDVCNDVCKIAKQYAASVNNNIKGEWMDMSSAPNDGTSIIVFDEDEGIMLVSWDTVEIYYPGCKPRKCWCVPGSHQDEQGGAYTSDKPLKWQPLPKAPNK
jgi:hypothetical protein